MSGTRYNPFAPTSQLIAEIMEAVEASHGVRYFGLRIEDGRRFDDGAFLPNSRAWVDGDPTNETVDGVSTIGIGTDPTAGSVSSALAAIAGYVGDTLILIGSRTRGDGGVDPGEDILRDGWAVRSWYATEPDAKTAGAHGVYR